MNTETQTSLFEPLTNSNLELKNRIVMAPMTRSRAIGSIPNDLMATYYAQRSSAGLIITEGVSPSPNGLGYARIPGVFNEEQVEGWKKVTDSVHAEDGKIFMQIMHTGRIAHPDNLPAGVRILGPSAVRPDVQMWTDQSGMQPIPSPEAMSEEDIEETIEEFATAAKNAIDAGFDGIELHGANGYLLEQFLNPHVNIRTDQYGGSVKNRIRFVLEVTRAVVDVIGKEKTAIRLSPFNTFNDMPEYSDTTDTYETLVTELEKLGIRYIHVVETAARTHEAGQQLLSTIYEVFSNLIIVNGGYSREMAEETLEKGRADMISFGRPFISNPDLPRKFYEGIPLAEPDSSTFYSADEKGYTDYSFSKN